MAKSVIGLLAGVPGASPKGGAPGKSKAEPSSPKSMAAQDMLEAFESGDASALEAAFTRMYNACADEQSSVGEYEDDEEL
jgi:hypothetical protein